jgi:hypothetical protein
MARDWTMAGILPPLQQQHTQQILLYRQQRQTIGLPLFPIPHQQMTNPRHGQVFSSKSQDVTFVFDCVWLTSYFNLEPSLSPNQQNLSKKQLLLNGIHLHNKM